MQLCARLFIINDDVDDHHHPKKILYFGTAILKFEPIFELFVCSFLLF